MSTFIRVGPDATVICIGESADGTTAEAGTGAGGGGSAGAGGGAVGSGRDRGNMCFNRLFL